MAANLPQKADYVIVGGGTSGLVVAARLSENPDINVVVLESGPNATDDPRVKDPAAWSTIINSDLDWKFKTAEQAALNNRKQDLSAGRLLGGSSAMNGLMYLPPSPAGIDAWAKLGNPKWNWESLRPYLQKSYTTTAPDSNPELKEGAQETASGPIKVTYPALAANDKDPSIQAWVEALKAQGYGRNTDILAEQKTVGTRDYAATIDPVSGLRSSADREYGTLAAARSNVTIVTGATVRKIVFDSGAGNVTATGVEVVLNSEPEIISAIKEVILAAGAFQTPKLLELSGIGSKERLGKLEIPVVIEQPGVGENLQNHLMSLLPVPLKPTPESSTIAPGPKAFAFVRLDLEEQKQILAAHPKSEDPAEQAIWSLIESPNEASASLILAVMPGNIALLVAIPSFPFSRGSTHISSTDPDAPPEIDAGFMSNNLDLEIIARHTRNLHDLASSEALSPLLQSVPAPENLEEIKDKLRASARGANHPCGTVAMRPLEEGGVVDQELKVYGVTNLRVVDASVFPLIPHANPMATVYAMAERAADIIRSV